MKLTDKELSTLERALINLAVTFDANSAEYSRIRKLIYKLKGQEHTT